jgi:hypothetical protein
MEIDELRDQVDVALESGDIGAVLTLLSSDEELLHLTTHFGTWLHVAAKLGQTHLIERLIAMGLDVNAEAKLGGTPLCMANVRPATPDCNAIFSAMYKSQKAVIKALIETGFDPHVVYRSVTGKLKNALSYATERGETEIVEILTDAGCKMPVEGVDVAVNEPASVETVTGADHSQILDRMASQFGSAEALSLQGIVPANDEVHVSVNVIRPNENCPFMTIFTTGMSDVAMTVPDGQEVFQYAELVMYLLGDWEIPQLNSDDAASLWPFQWLRNIAYLPHNEGTWLGGPHTIISSDDPPVPLGPNTDLTCLLLNADMMDWSPMELADGRKIRFYTVMPIYTEERDFEVKNGIVQLLQRFEEIGIPPILLPGRPNVVGN